jgi:ABC-type transport system substrate-binding protein
VGIDDLIAAQRRATDPAQRADLLRQAQIRIAQDVPVIPIYAPIYVTAHASYLTGDLPNTSDWIVDFARLRFLDLNACVPCK